MVHALEEIHRLLKPAGTLIEIHPSVDAPPFVESWYQTSDFLRPESATVS